MSCGRPTASLGGLTSSRTLASHHHAKDNVPGHHSYAAYTGTAPIEFSSGGRITHRLSRRGDRRLNHALHRAAITQIRHRHSPGRSYYDRKLAEGKTPREAIHALKRRLSDVVWRHLVADVRRVAAP